MRRRRRRTKAELEKTTKCVGGTSSKDYMSIIILNVTEYISHVQNSETAFQAGEHFGSRPANQLEASLP